MYSNLGYWLTIIINECVRTQYWGIRVVSQLISLLDTEVGTESKCHAKLN